MINDQRWSRRRLLVGTAGFAGGVAALGLVGCGDDGSNADKKATNPTGADPKASLSPVAGGTLSAGQVTDIALNTGYPYVLLPQNRFLMFGVSEPLVRYADSLKPTPVMVDRYELSDDNTQVTVSLKPGLRFHNGDAVTPEDVFFGIDLMVAPQDYNVTGGIQLATFAKVITSKTKVDDRTMIFKFDKPRPNITDFFAQMMITQAKSYKELQTGKNIQGTGPFKFVSWTPSQSYRLEKNASWHGSTQPGGGPYLDGITVSEFSDVEALGLSLESGQVELALELPGSVAKKFKDRNRTRIAPKVGLLYAGCNVTNPMLKDPRVRQALFLAIDRARLVDEIGEGFGKVTVQPWPATSPAYDPALDAAFYDPSKAKQLLSAASFQQTGNLKIEFGSGGSQAVPELVKQNFADIGVRVDLVPVEGNALTAKITQRQVTDLWITTHAFADMAPLTNFQQTFPFRIPNPSGYASDEYKAIIAALEQLDPLSAGAKQQYARFNKMWLEDPWMLPLQPRIRIDVVGEKLQGLNDYFITIYQSFDMAKLWKKT